MRCTSVHVRPVRHIELSHVRKLLQYKLGRLSGWGDRRADGDVAVLAEVVAL